MLAVICSLFAHPDHLCFDRTTYDNINGLGGPFMFDIIGPAGPLMYPDQIFRDRPYTAQLDTADFSRCSLPEISGHGYLHKMLRNVWAHNG